MELVTHVIVFPTTLVGVGFALTNETVGSKVSVYVTMPVTPGVKLFARRLYDIWNQARRAAPQTHCNITNHQRRIRDVLRDEQCHSGGLERDRPAAVLHNQTALLLDSVQDYVRQLDPVMLRVAHGKEPTGLYLQDRLGQAPLLNRCEHNSGYRRGVHRPQQCHT
ncbi:MAG: hypothetical protein R2818_03600 [Flavobacteriales bacterium]